MTLQSLCTAISELAKQQRVINFSAAGTDIYSLNTQTIKDYPCLYVAPTGAQRVEENVTHYRIVLTYFDRLLQDSSNELDIVSVGIEQVKNLVRWIKDLGGVVDVDWDYNIIPFTDVENFNDRLNGVYTEIVVTCLNETICAIE